MGNYLAAILDRLGTSAEFWEDRLQKLFGKSRLLGSYFSTAPDRLRVIAARQGVHHVDNSVQLSSTG